MSARILFYGWWQWHWLLAASLLWVTGQEITEQPPGSVAVKAGKSQRVSRCVQCSTYIWDGTFFFPRWERNRDILAFEALSLIRLFVITNSSATALFYIYFLSWILKEQAMALAPLHGSARWRSSCHWAPARRQAWGGHMPVGAFLQCSILWGTSGCWWEPSVGRGFGCWACRSFLPSVHPSLAVCSLGSSMFILCVVVVCVFFFCVCVGIYFLKGWMICYYYY